MQAHKNSNKKNKNKIKPVIVPKVFDGSFNTQTLNYFLMLLTFC